MLLSRGVAFRSEARVGGRGILNIFRVQTKSRSPKFRPAEPKRIFMIGSRRIPAHQPYSWHQATRREVSWMIFVLTSRIDRWFKQFPRLHRTDQQGQRIVCPRRESRGYPAEEIHGRPSRRKQCTICGANLGRVVTMRGERDEFYWLPPFSTRKPG